MLDAACAKALFSPKASPCRSRRRFDVLSQLVHGGFVRSGFLERRPFQGDEGKTSDVASGHTKEIGSNNITTSINGGSTDVYHRFISLWRASPGLANCARSARKGAESNAISYFAFAE
jgi:hypothetical protein